MADETREQAPSPLGRIKHEVCRRLLSDWQDVADLLDIPREHCARFPRGREPQGVWEWLQDRQQLPRLTTALKYLDRSDLVEVLQDLPLAVMTAFRQAYQACAQRWSEVRYALDKRFVYLTLLLDQGEDATGPRWQHGSAAFNDLGEVLHHVTESAIVVLGAPGSGKSTLLRHFELENAHTVLEGDAANDLTTRPMTFFVSLNGYGPSSVDQALPTPRAWLSEQWRLRHPDLPPLETLLREKRLTLLLDALNEMPQASAEPMQLWKAFLRELDDAYPGNRVVFSCRSLDYSASLSSRERPVPQVRIEPLADEQVKEFVKLYCPDHGDTLWQNLQGSPQLEVLRSPYYLKLLIDQTIAGEIPAGRAALFTGFVRQVLRREIEGDNPLLQAGALLDRRDVLRLNQLHGWPPFELPERGSLLPQLSTLAWQMQRQRIAQESSQVRIKFDAALALLDPEQAEDVLKAGVDLNVLEHDLGRDEVLFVHQLLQEYFAARQLARQPQAELVHQEWRVERVTPDLPATLQTLADADPLPPLPSTGWEETTILAASMAPDPDRFITELMVHNLALAGRCAAQAEANVSEGLKDTLRWALIERTQDARADLRVRIAAGLALGELGDPRFERRQGADGGYLLPPLVELPGGRYPIGSDEGVYEEEAPVHRVELQAFAIGQFPVTNAEWALFMQAGGYNDEHWWDTEAARAWRRGKNTAEGPKRQWRENRKYVQEHFDSIRQWHREQRITSKQADDWELIAQMSDADFEA